MRAVKVFAEPWLQDNFTNRILKPSERQRQGEFFLNNGVANRQVGRKWNERSEVLKLDKL